MLLSLPNELLTTVGFFLATTGSDGSTSHGPPSSLLPLLLAHPTLNEALSFDRNPTLYAQILYNTFDTAAITRRFGSDVLGESRKAANELRSRWTLLKRIRKIGQDETPVPEQEGGIQRAAEDLMHVFLILTENDGRNLGQLLAWAKLSAYLLNFHLSVMIPRALEPGYPDDTPDKALFFTIAAWLDEADYFTKQYNLRGRQSGLAAFKMPEFPDTPAQTDEAVFVMRPFALALHRYDAYFCPWTTRQLPVPPSLPRPSPFDPDADPHVADLQPRNKGVHMTRFNQDYSICPPSLTLSASMGLMSQLDRNPCLGGLSDSSSNSSTCSLDFLYPVGRKFAAPLYAPPFVAESSTGTYLRQSIPLVNLPSRIHDLDVKRLLACSDPWTGGLDALAFRGKFEGTYHGSFSFFDFAGYREMLGGNVQALYDGTFGQQAQQIILTERVVRVHRSVLGGTGPLINAGFPLPGSPPDPFTLCYSKEEEDAPEPEGSEYVKELLIDGLGRSGWGDFKCTGRVRAWDGLVTFVKEYVTRDALGNEPAMRGKWVYRGYLKQDSRFVGNWRDCFTDVQFRGYEGSFHMRRQSERFLVPVSSPSYPINSPLPHPTSSLVRSSSPINTNPCSPLLPYTLASPSPSPKPTPLVITPPLSLHPALDGPESDAFHPVTLQKLHYSGFQEELSSGVMGSEVLIKRKRNEVEDLLEEEAAKEVALEQVGGSWVDRPDIKEWEEGFVAKGKGRAKAKRVSGGEEK